MGVHLEERFRAADEAICWAEEACAELRQQIELLDEDNRFELIDAPDQATGLMVRKAVMTLPSRIRRCITEALIHARHSCDQSTYAACTVFPFLGPVRRLGFPWAESPADLRGRLAQFDPALHGAFFSLEPYPTSGEYEGGNLGVRIMSKIANDKHSVGVGTNGRVTRFSTEELSSVGDGHLEILVPRWDHARNEIALMRWSGTPPQHGVINISFEIVLTDERFPAPQNAVQALEAFVQFARQTHRVLQEACFPAP